MDSSIMALCGSTLFDNGSVTGITKPCSFRCPCIKDFGLLHHSYSSVLKKGTVNIFYSCNGSHLSSGGLFSSLPNARFTSYKQTSALLSLRTSQVRSTMNSESSGGNERFTVDEQTLERDLEIAIAEEDYTKTAENRDNLKALQEDSETSVLMANS